MFQLENQYSKFAFKLFELLRSLRNVKSFFRNNRFPRFSLDLARGLCDELIQPMPFS